MFKNYKVSKSAFIVGITSSILGIIFFAILYYLIFNNIDFSRRFDYSGMVGIVIFVTSITTINALYRGDKASIASIFALFLVSLSTSIYLIFYTNNILQWYIVVPILILIAFILSVKKNIKL